MQPTEADPETTRDVGSDWGVRAVRETREMEMLTQTLNKEDEITACEKHQQK